MQRKTTGATISRLGVLTVMAYNQLPNYLSAYERGKAKAAIQMILDGDTGVPTEKVAIRSAERCAIGGAMFGVETPLGTISWGMN